MSEENKDDILLTETAAETEVPAQAAGEAEALAEAIQENITGNEEAVPSTEETVTASPIEDSYTASEEAKADYGKKKGAGGLLTFCIILVIIAIVVVIAAIIITQSMKKNGRVSQDASVIDSVTAFFKGEDASKNTPEPVVDSNTSSVVINAEPDDGKSDSTGDAVTTSAPSASTDTEPVEIPTFEVTTTLGQYKGVTVDYGDITVTDEEIEAEIEYFLEENAETVDITDRAAELGDTVLIDFVGKLDGVAFDGGSAEDQELRLGSGKMIPGFEEAIVGHKKGESFSFDITFPEDYHGEELAGKATTFDIKLKSITGYITPELTDALVAENTDYATVEEYREALRELAVEDKIAFADSEAQYNIYTAIIDSSSFGGQIEEEIAYNKEQFMEQLNATAEANGVDAELIAAYFYGMTLEDIDRQIAYSVKFSHILDEIAKIENIEVTEEEFNEEFENTFYYTYGFENEEAVYEQISKEEAADMINRTVKSNKAEKIITDNAIINGK